MATKTQHPVADTRSWFVDILSSVQVTVKDPSVIDRCVENHNEDGVPQEPGGDGWRDHYYDLATADDVLHHLAFNCAVNGIEQVNRLDGWADLPDDAATMRLDRVVEFERIVEAEG